MQRIKHICKCGKVAGRKGDRCLDCSKCLDCGAQLTTGKATRCRPCYVAYLPTLQASRWTRFGAAERQKRLAGLVKHRGIASDTKLERRMRKALLYLGVVFVEQGKVGPYYPDFVSGRVIIETDGCYHHGCQQCGYPEKPEPTRRLDYLIKRGFTVVRFWEHEVKGPVKPLLARLRSLELVH